MNNKNNKSRKGSKRSRSKSRGSKAAKAAKPRPRKVSRRRSGKRNRKSRGGYVNLPPTDQVAV